MALRHRVVLVAEPAPRRTGVAARLIGGLRDTIRRWRGRHGELAGTASALGVPWCRAVGRRDPGLVRRLRRLQPDILCVAGWPWILPPEVYSIPRLGAINLHTSLLPRHRGPMPLFWIYAHDDRETGVTVHWVAEGADTGDIILQERLPLGRGENIVPVHAASADLGATLMTAALDAIERGVDTRTQQDERLATIEPVAWPGAPMVDFAEWDVERVWHMLAGLFPMFREPLRNSNGSPIRYSAVLGFERGAHDEPLGSVVEAPGHYVLHCRGGVVRLGRKAAAP